MEAIPSLIVIAIALACFGVWVYAIVDLLRAPRGLVRNGSKALWALVLVLGHFVGALIYLMVGRPRKHFA